MAKTIIPTRRPLLGLSADQAAEVLFDSLISGWGLTNAKKIVAALKRTVDDEYKRRKKLES